MINNNKNKKDLAMWGIVIFSSILFILIIGISLLFFVFGKDRNIIVSSVHFVIPAQEEQAATYYPPQKLNIFVGDEEVDDNNDGKADHPAVEVGEQDLEEGTYLVDELELDEYCSLKVRDKNSDNMFAGTQYYKGDTLFLTNDDELSAFNCRSHNGGLKVELSKEKELKTAAIESTPEINSIISMELHKDLLKEYNNIEDALFIWKKDEFEEEWSQITLDEVEVYLDDQKMQELNDNLEKQVEEKGWDEFIVQF